MIPGPPARAFFATVAALGRDPLAYLLDAHRRYGNVHRVPLAHRSFVVLTGPDAIERVLIERAKHYDKRTATFAKLRSVVGGGLLTSDGDDWLARRRIAQPAFHRSREEDVARITAEATEAMLASWRTRGPAERRAPLDVGRQMASLTLTIAITALLGADLGDRRGALLEAAASVIGHTNDRIEAWLDVPRAVPTRANRAFGRARSELDRIVFGVLDEARASASAPAELLSRLQAAGLPREALRDELVTMLLAGHETTANVLTWALDAIARSPRVMQRLLTEHATVIGDREPTAADVARLPYTARVLREVMRLRPPAWILERRATDDDVVSGHPIPRGTVVAICPWVTHRDPALWQEPERFDPDRFLPEREAGRPRLAYLPFGGGARQCIGGRFASIEAAIVVAKVLREFAIAPATRAPAEPMPGVTLRPRTPALLTATPVAKGALDGGA